MLAERVFKALADPGRLRLLKLLGGEPVCVGDLVAATRLPQPVVSRHLAMLRDAGLVRDQRSAQWTFYRRAPQGGAFLRRVLAAVESAELPESARDAAQLAALRKSGGCCPRHPKRGRHG